MEPSVFHLNSQYIVSLVSIWIFSIIKHSIKVVTLKLNGDIPCSLLPQTLSSIKQLFAPQLSEKFGPKGPNNHAYVVIEKTRAYIIFW